MVGCGGFGLLFVLFCFCLRVCVRVCSVCVCVCVLGVLGVPGDARAVHLYSGGLSRGTKHDAQVSPAPMSAEGLPAKVDEVQAPPAATAKTRPEWQRKAQQ